MRRTRFEASLDKKCHVNKCEQEGLIADSMDVRKDLIAKMSRGEMTLDQVQAELKKIKRNARKNGRMTRSQAFRAG